MKRPITESTEGIKEDTEGKMIYCQRERELLKKLILVWGTYTYNESDKLLQKNR
ncbi:MAG: hypothetical protein WC139_02480 [Candidatus Kapaibacterium sp.]